MNYMCTAYVTHSFSSIQSVAVYIRIKLPVSLFSFPLKFKLLKSNFPKSVKPFCIPHWGYTAAADGADPHVRNMDRFITHPFKGKTGTCFIVVSRRPHRLSVSPVSATTILSFFFLFFPEILSPSHLRCSGYEKQFPVCQFPWRLAEDHGASVSLAVRRREKVKCSNTRTVWWARWKPQLIIKHGRNTSGFPSLCHIIKIKKKRWHCCKRHVDYKIFIVMFVNFVRSDNSSGTLGGALTFLARISACGV